MTHAGFFETEAVVLEQFLWQLHGANALVVAFDRSCFFTLALSRWLFVELACAQVGQQAELFDGALEAAQGYVKRLVVFNTNGRH